MTRLKEHWKVLMVIAFSLLALTWFAVHNPVMADADGYYVAECFENAYTCDQTYAYVRDYLHEVNADEAASLVELNTNQLSEVGSTLAVNGTGVSLTTTMVADSCGYVDVILSLSYNSGIGSFMTTILFNESVLNPVAVTDTNNFRDLELMYTPVYVSRYTGEQVFLATNVDLSSMSYETGVIATMRFRISDGFRGCLPIGIEYFSITTDTEIGEIMAYSVSGYNVGLSDYGIRAEEPRRRPVTVGGIAFGDINGDAWVNDADVQLLRNFLAQAPITVFNKRAADVNVRGFLNDDDVMTLRMFIAHHPNGIIGPPAGSLFIIPFIGTHSNPVYRAEINLFVNNLPRGHRRTNTGVLAIVGIEHNSTVGFRVTGNGRGYSSGQIANFNGATRAVNLSTSIVTYLDVPITVTNMSALPQGRSRYFVITYHPQSVSLLYLRREDTLFGGGQVIVNERSSGRIRLEVRNRTSPFAGTIKTLRFSGLADNIGNAGINITSYVGYSTHGVFEPYNMEYVIPTETALSREGIARFQYLVPCVQSVSIATIDDNFEDNSVIIVLDRATSRLASRDNRVFSSTDFRDIGALYVENLVQLSDNENAYAQRIWMAEQQRVLEDSMLSVYGESSISVAMEYFEARTLGEANTLVDFDEFRQILLVRLDQNCKENVLNAVKQLQSRDYIIVAEPNFLLSPDSFNYVPNPTDTFFRLPNTHENHQWSIRRIGLPQAWRLIGNSHTYDIEVGILGHGIDASHPELRYRVSALHRGQLTEIRSGTGYGYGTQQAGIIGARGNNSYGIAGISWNARPISIEAGSANHIPAISQHVEAVNEGRRALVPILSRSWGACSFAYEGPGGFVFAVRSYRGLFVNAGGNGCPFPRCANWPYCHDPTIQNGCNTGQNVTARRAQLASLPNVLNVGATDRNDNRRFYSNYGQGSIHLFAPSGVITTRATHIENSTGFTMGSGYTTTNERHYHGTSASAPHVSGVAALLLSYRPHATTQQIRQAILDGVDWVPQLEQVQHDNSRIPMSIANGRLNAYGALRQLLAMPEITVTSSTPWLSFNGTQFVLGNIGLATARGQSLHSRVHVRVNRRNATGMLVGTQFGATNIGVPGTGTFIPNSSVNIFNTNQHIEIRVYDDNTPRMLISRQVVRPYVPNLN